MNPLIPDLFAQWTAQLGLPEVALDATGMAALEIEQGIIVNFQAQPSPAVLTLLAWIGPLPQDWQAALMQDMLEANLLWIATGGATLSLQRNAQTGMLDAVVAQSMAVHKGSAVTELQRVFDNLCLVALDWKARLEQPGRWLAPAESGNHAFPRMPASQA